MKVALIVQIPGPMHGKKIPIPVAAFSIGRDPQSALQAEDPAIAPQHCVLAVRDDKLFVRDLDTPAGTFVNDLRISGEVALRDGDRLRVGPLLFRARVETPKESVSAKPKPQA